MKKEKKIELPKREIKFRCWDKVERKMMYNIMFAIKNDLIVITDENCCGVGPNGYFEVIFKNAMPIERIVLMQYTGLKDKNGREIYESDLVIWDGQKKPVEVIWRRQGWYPVINSTTEVVGNKYEGIKNKN